MPIAIAPIAADVDKEWVGSDLSIEECKKILALPNVEVASHTFTHPFHWKFFEEYEPSKEYPYLSEYPNGTWLGRGMFARVRAYFKKDSKKQWEKLKDYDYPRAFAIKPFSLELEIKGSCSLINDLSPENKKVTLYQWSGNCRPFPRAMAEVEELRIPNMNGGDTRFDKEYPSYCYVTALGREVGSFRQVYSSNTNENLYTELWKGRFWGFNQLTETFDRTERPIRVKPMNLYYHTYSAQKAPALTALLSNIKYIREKERCSIDAGKYPEIVLGFYDAQIEKEGDTYVVKNRRGLQTLRFDFSSTKSVDFEKSKGVIGQRYFQGSLYVFLDKSEEEIAISLIENSDFPMEKSGAYSLLSSSWEVFNVSREEGILSFDAQGYGNGGFVWTVPKEGLYLVNGEEYPSKEGRIQFQVEGVIPQKRTFNVQMKN